MTAPRKGWLIQPITFLLFALFLLLQYQLLIADGGFLPELTLEKQIASQQQVNEQLTLRNQRMVESIADLKKGDLQRIETIARTELGKVKKGEQYYQLVYQP